MIEILAADSFVCHNRTDLQCAGHMIIKGEENTFFRLAKRFKINLGLRGKELVFESKEECINHHSNE